MDHKQILTDLKNKVYHPVYFLSGEEPYYIDIVADYIEDNILDAGEKEFNQTIVYGKETDMITIISAGTVIHKPNILAEELVSLSLGTKNLK